MEKIMMMFPGVGSQQTGMGKDFYENRTSARDVMDEACDISVSYTHLDVYKRQEILYAAAPKGAGKCVGTIFTRRNFITGF